MEYLSPKDGGPLLDTFAKTAPLCGPFANGAIIVLTLIATVLTRAALAAPVPIVRVMVERERQSFKIEGFDLLVSDAATDRKIAHENRRAVVQVKCSLGGQMDLTLSKNEKKRVSGPLHVSSLGGFIRVGASQYRDDLYIYSFNGDCVVVNHVDLEKYVAGLLNSEMSASWSLSTLKAQAVAARTYAIYQMRESSSTRYRKIKAPFDLDSSVKDQVYEGAHQERYKALLAVQQTRGQVLTYDGKPIKAFYHSTCGGRTESPEKVWGLRLPYMRPVKCGFCEGSPRYNWAYSLNTADIERKLHGERLLQGRLVSMMVLNRNLVGRADKVEIRGTLGTIIVSAPRVREVIGNLHLRSTDFSVVNDNGKFTFVGHGSGHAVGMCQWGAKTMGERGRSHAEILKYYYPAAQLSKLY